MNLPIIELLRKLLKDGIIKEWIKIDEKTYQIRFK